MSARFWLLLVVVAMAASAALPEPPRQHQAWTAPSVEGLPDYIVHTTTLLFGAGLADPRGGDYREIELAYEGRLIHTHGWVFDNGYAVCWNGLVYRVQSAGEPADLRRDVQAIASLKSWGPFIREAPPEAAFWTEIESSDVRAPISIALMLRLGEAGLVSELWQVPEWSSPRGDFRNERVWANAAILAWLGTAFHRLVRERSGGDNRAAVETAESLEVWGERLKSNDDLSFLKPVPVLLADSQRRLGELSRSKLDARALLKKPQADRVAELIEWLEDVAAQKMMWPGPLMFMLEPTCELLAKEGEAAVGPLLDAYEHDERLTRTVDFGRPWYIERRPVPVREVVRAVLGSILQVPSVIDHASPSELRAWWEKHNGKNQLERSFGILAADNSTPDEWAESADVITLRSDIERSGGGLKIPQGVCSPEKPAPAAFGEVLRARKNPSVSELLAKRAAQTASIRPELACRLASMAYLWDAKTAPTVLQSVSRLEECQGDAMVTAARVELGDLQAIADWAPIIRKKASAFGFRTSELLPLWLFPGNPLLDPVAQALFAGPQAPLSPLNNFDNINTTLLAVPAYRRAVLSAIRDASVVGSASRSTDGSLSIAMKNSALGRSGNEDPDDREARPGEKRPVRVKDMVAWQLSEVSGFPAFKPDWPEADKDTAAANIAEFLLQHEKDLRAFPARLQDAVCFTPRVYLQP